MQEPVSLVVLREGTRERTQKKAGTDCRQLAGSCIKVHDGIGELSFSTSFPNHPLLA